MIQMGTLGETIKVQTHSSDGQVSTSLPVHIRQGSNSSTTDFNTRLPSDLRRGIKPGRVRPGGRQPLPTRIMTVRLFRGARASCAATSLHRFEEDPPSEAAAFRGHACHRGQGPEHFVVSGRDHARQGDLCRSRAWPVQDLAAKGAVLLWPAPPGWSGCTSRTRR
jgi:hypothetical protein